MIEAAARISGGEVDAGRIVTIIDYGRRLLDRPVELIDGVEEVLDALDHHRLMVITKGRRARPDGQGGRQRPR